MTTSMSDVVVLGDAALIPVGGGVFTIVDVADLDRVTAFKWSRNNSSASGKHVYARNRTAGYLHRFITGAPTGTDVDHINHNTLDNRRSNLRVCSHQSNLLNQTRKSEASNSGARGVFLRREKHGTYYQARVTVRGKARTKNFPGTPEGLEAAKAEVERLRANLLRRYEERYDIEEEVRS